MAKTNGAQWVGLGVLAVGGLWLGEEGYLGQDIHNLLHRVSVNTGSAPPSPTAAPTAPASGPANAGSTIPAPNAVAQFVAAYHLDPSDQTAPWVIFYDQQFNSWPANDLTSGAASAASLYDYAVNAIGYLRSIGVSN